MAAAKSEKANVEYHQDANGDHHVGVKLGGVFVPFASVDAQTASDRVAAGKSPEAKEAAGSPPDEGEE
jgi:hypothetical protein